MSCSYTVLRYVPDPVAGESVNLALVAVDEAGTSVEMLENWHRAASFAGLRPAELRDLVSEFTIKEGLFESHDPSTGDLRPERLEAIVREWQGVLQFTPLRGSLRSRQDLVTALAPRMLKNLAHKKKAEEGVSKLVAVRAAKRALTRAVAERQVNNLFTVVDKANAMAVGRVPHHFDYGLKNGEIRLGGYGLSLDLVDPGNVETQIDLIGGAALDLRSKGILIPLALVVVGNWDLNRKKMDRADKWLGESQVDLLKIEQVPGWHAEKVAEIVLGFAA